MLTPVGSFAQQLHQRPHAMVPSASEDDYSLGALVRRPVPRRRTFILEQRLVRRPVGVFVAENVFIPEPGFPEEAVASLAIPEILRREPRGPSPMLTEEQVMTARSRPELLATTEESDVQPLVMGVKALIESERIVSARELLAAVPSSITGNPIVIELRAVLAPPVVKRIERRDVDRSLEYEWLRREGRKYRGYWVALDGDQLVASAASLRELRETVKALSLPRPPLVHRID